jgi:hypothetical protein
MIIKKYIIREVKDMDTPPPLFLPVRRFHNRLTVEYCIFPLAIPLIFLLIIKNILMSIWIDLRWVLYELEKTNKMKDESYKE